MQPSKYQLRKSPEHGADWPFDGAETCVFDGCFGCDYCEGRPGNVYHATNADLSDHQDCPDDCEDCGPRRYLPEDTSVDPILKERSDKYFTEVDDWLEGGKDGDRPVYPGARNYKDAVDQEDDHDLPDTADTEAATETAEDIVIRYTGPDPNPDIVRDKNHKMAGTKRSNDEFGREIFIDEEFENGRLKTWYYLNPNGRIMRWRSNGQLSTPDVLDELPPIAAPDNCLTDDRVKDE